MKNKYEYSLPDEKDFFKYGEKEINYLRAKDPLLGDAIDRIGFIKRPVKPDIFMALINSIIGQQISTKAQDTVWRRFKDKFAPITAENVDKFSVEELQSCGISMRKASYIKGITSSIVNGNLDLSLLEDMSDKEVCSYLCQIKGVGVWTAEMLMTFSMERMDILSYGDLAILRGIRMLYGHEKVTPKLFTEYKEKYSPYGTVASLYLWAIAGGALPELTDPAIKV